jgi:hypothetical protein
MRRARTLCPFIVAGVIGSWTAVAAASPAHSPPPVAGEPSCNGLIIAAFNHETVNPHSGNPNSSSGPGPFFGPATHEAIEELARGPNC